MWQILGIVLFVALSCKVAPPNESTEESSSVSGFIASRDFFDKTGQAWTGRLIMPEPSERRADGGVWFEVYDGAKGTSFPKRLWLTWDTNSGPMKALVRRTTIDVQMDPTDLANGKSVGNKPPEKINGLKKVSFLESLAGSRSADVKDKIAGQLTSDSMEVLIKKAKISGDTLLISSEPIQIVGRHVTLLKFINRESTTSYRASLWKGSDFSGETKVNYENPQVTKKNMGWIPTLEGIEKMPDNQFGWYAFGDIQGSAFTVRAIEPRAAMRLDRGRPIRNGIEFINNENFKDMKSKKGTIEINALQKSMQLNPKPGVKGLVIHLFGGIDGQNADNPISIPGTSFQFYTGHFAFGVAEVVTDPFTNQPKLDIEYRQVYATNEQSIVSGATKWHSFSGSLKRGWMYARPLSDSIIWHPSLMYPYSMNGTSFDPMESILDELTVMTARFRTSDGHGIAKVTSSTSCVQDASQAMFISMSNFQKWSNQTEIRSYIASNPNDENVKRLLAFKELSRDYLEGIIKWAGARDDWGDAKAGLVVNRKEEKGIVAAIKGAATMALSYKFVAPRFANDNMLKMFYERNALIWIVKTSQIGGEKQGIFPAAAGCETNCLAEFQKMFKFGGN